MRSTLVKSSLGMGARIFGGAKRLFHLFLFPLLVWSPAAIAQTAPNLRVAWDANNTEPDLAGYHIYYGPESRFAPQSRGYTNRITVGIITRAEIPALIPGATYYLAVVAFDTAGIESLFSNELTNRVPGADNLPPTLDPIGDLTVAEDGGL